MEAKLTEKLRYYGSLRGIVLDSAFRYIPKKVFDQNAVFHTLVLLCASTVVAAIFSTTRRLTLFSLHPTCMTIGTVLFFAEGIVSYRNGTLLEILSPIMQKDKKSKVRAIHQSLQMGGALFIALGMMFIVANKLEHHKSIVPMSVHSILGCVAIFILAAQAVSGQEKMVQLEGGNKRVRRWHGDAGLLLWDLLCVTMIFGLISFLSVSFATGLVLLSVVGVWLAVHAQMLSRSSIHKYDSSNSIDDSPAAGFGGGVILNSYGHGHGLDREDSFGGLDVECAGAERDLDGAGDSDRLIGTSNSNGNNSAGTDEHAGGHDYDN